MRLPAALLLVAAITLPAVPAAAQPYPEVMDRDFALDLYSGGIVGGVRVIGMGGAAVAIAVGSTGTLANVAAPAVRRETKHGTFGWDAHFDGQSAAFADDFDNNGLPDTDDASSQLGTAGLVIQYGDWGFGITASTTSTQIVEDDGDAATMDGILEPQGSIAKIVVARSFLDETHTVGVGLRLASLSMVRPRAGLDKLELFRVSGPSAEAGYLWRPRERSNRVGLAAALPVRNLTSVTVSGCDPLNCEGYILPERVEAPWMAAVGYAHRFASTPWNVEIDSQYRDERALLVAADLVVHGAVEDGHGLEAYARHMLQPSGRRPVVSPRAGAEAEVIPGWVRLRTGTYWEPSRFPGVAGRLHATAGADVRLFQFSLFGTAYRPRISFTADRAREYGNLGVSFGFWN